MKLDRFVLIMVALIALVWLVAALSGLIAAGPYGLLGIVPLGIFVAVIGVVIYQRLRNTEDDYYRDNVDK